MATAGRAEYMGSGRGVGVGCLMRAIEEETRRLRWMDELCDQKGHSSVTLAVLVHL